MLSTRAEPPSRGTETLIGSPGWGRAVLRTSGGGALCRGVFDGAVALLLGDLPVGPLDVDVVPGPACGRLVSSLGLNWRYAPLTRSATPAVQAATAHHDGRARPGRRRFGDASGK